MELGFGLPSLLLSPAASVVPARASSLFRDARVGQLTELPPSSGMQEWASSPLVSTVLALSILGVRGFPAGPPALVFNFKQHLVVECLHIRAN